jgi:hypothetical protein
MGLGEWHPFCESEIERVPAIAGVFVLFRIEVPVHVAGAANLRKALRAAKTEHAAATHFAIEPPRQTRLSACVNCAKN